MFAINNFNGIIEQERQINEQHIVILLFVKPSDKGASDIIDQFNYIHHSSKRFCSIYAIGYSEGKFTQDYPDVRKIAGINNSDWYYSDKCFVEFIDYLQSRLSWVYSGEPEVIILQSNPDSRSILTFQNYITIDINYGIKKEYIESFPRFLTSIINSSKSEVEAIRAVNKADRSRFRLVKVLETAIDGSKKIPAPAKRILKDRLFYRTCLHHD